MQKITIEAINLKYQKPTEVKSYYFELHDEHLTCLIRFLADEPIVAEDESSGWEQSLTDSEYFVKRSAITGIDLYKVDDPDVYCVLISAVGIAQDCKTYFKTRKEAK